MDDDSLSASEEAAGLMQAAAFPGLKPSPKTQLRAQLAEAARRREADHEYIRRLEAALAAHGGVNDIQVIRRTLPKALSSSPGANFPLRQPSSFASVDGSTPTSPMPFPLPPPPSSAPADQEQQRQQQQQQQQHGPYLHERTPSQMERPDYAAILAGEGAGLGQPRLIRSDTAFAHATEVRFDDLTYTVQKPAERADAITVGAQCMRFWSWPLACLLSRQPADQRVTRKILNNIRGVLLPGRLTLLLGPPGSGKSTFLKALSGRLPRTRTTVLKGRVTYNGDTAESHRFSLPKVVALVPQEDCHAPTLTVKETVQFAFDCMNGPQPKPARPAAVASPLRRGGGGSATDLLTRGLLPSHQQQHQSPPSPTPSATATSPFSSPVAAGKRPDKVDQTLRVLGLSRCQDTIVGNALLRGISGGEKKRLTTAEMTGGQVNVLLMDSISTGLDSAATFDICKTLSLCTRALQANIVVALLQPPPEVANLFDDVILMSEGQIVYHGPREQVLPHFESLGFRCPPRKDVADFLVEVTTPLGAEHAIPAAERYAAGIPDPPTNTDEFVRAFQQTEVYQNMVDLLERPPSFAPWLRRQRCEFSNSWLRSTWLCLERQVKITLRDRVFLRGRLVQVAVMGVMAGTLFYQLGQHQWSDKLCLLFFSLMFTALGSLASIPVCYEQRSCFWKQRDSGFFPTSAAVVAQMLVQLPIQLVETLVFTSLAYFLTGLSRAGHGSFYISYLTVVLCTALAIGQTFRLIVHLVPGLAQAQPISALLILLFVVFSGLTIKGDDVPFYWKWLYWVNPLAWGLRALAINEFSSPTYGQHIVYPPPVPKPIPCDPARLDLVKAAFPTGSHECLSEGEIYLVNLGFKTTRDWIAYGVLYLLGMWAVMLLLTTLAMHWVRWSGRSTVAPPASPSPKKQQQQQQQQRKASSSAPQQPQQPQQDAFAYRLLEQGGGEGEGSAATAATATASSSLPFEPVTLVFKHMWYSVEVPKPQGGGTTRTELLKGVSGYAKPGTMTALMGSSGAGKTTLLDVLAGRKTTGRIIGEILVNGRPKEQRRFSRIMGYVEQVDVHSPHSTVKEALLFSAMLRLPYHQVSEEQRRAFVDEILRLLELEEIADRIIGEDAESGLLMGERKRLTIGVELVANPSVLFLDEPTTGLDARAAVLVMRTVKRIAEGGRSVICTIHQPSCAIFELFDMLLLLRHGGRAVYFGPLGENSADLIRYLEAAPGVTPIKPGVNPANWMLECIGAGIAPNAASARLDFADFYAAHPLSRHNEALMEGLSVPEDDGNDGEGSGATATATASVVPTTSSSPLVAAAAALLSPYSSYSSSSPRGGGGSAFSSRYATPFSVQLRACMAKAATNYWRSPNYNFTRMCVSVVVALLFGSVFHGKGYGTETELVGRIGLMYMSTSFMAIVNMMSVMPVMAKERSAFYREQASSMYSPLAYAVSSGLVELPWLLLTTGLFTSLFYWLVGLAAAPLSKFLWYWAFFGLYVASLTFIGQFAICLLPNQQTAQVAGASLAALFNLLGGYLCTPASMPPFWRAIYHLVPSSYMLEGLVMSQFEGDDTPVQPIYGTHATAAYEYVYQHFGGSFTYDHKWRDLGVLLLYIGALRLGTSLVLAFVRHISR